MKLKILFFFTFLIPFISKAQDKGYYSIAFGKDFPKRYHVIGGYFSGNVSLGKGFYIGPGGAFLKFDNTEKLYFPVFANLSMLKEKTGKKIFPVALVQPGYGFYTHTENGITTKGGFTFHTSAGIGYPFLWKTRGYTTLGLGHYTFKSDQAKNHRTSWGLRIGMVI